MKTKFQITLERALNHITGYPVKIENIDNGEAMVSYIANQLQKETGIDSADLAEWIKKSLKEYSINQAVFAQLS